MKQFFLFFVASLVRGNHDTRVFPASVTHCAYFHSGLLNELRIVADLPMRAGCLHGTLNARCRLPQFLSQCRRDNRVSPRVVVNLDLSVFWPFNPSQVDKQQLDSLWLLLMTSKLNGCKVGATQAKAVYSNMSAHLSNSCKPCLNWVTVTHEWIV